MVKIESTKEKLDGIKPMFVGVENPYEEYCPLGLFQNENGYLVCAHTRKYLHRIIYERHYKRIPRNWVVHHINGKKMDNRTENLISLPYEFHDFLHKKFPMWLLPNREFIEKELKLYEDTGKTPSNWAKKKKKKKPKKPTKKKKKLSDWRRKPKFAGYGEHVTK